MGNAVDTSTDIEQMGRVERRAFGDIGRVTALKMLLARHECENPEGDDKGIPLLERILRAGRR